MVKSLHSVSPRAEHRAWPVLDISHVAQGCQQQDLTEGGKQGWGLMATYA
jgi:hypothetical protein